MRILEAVKTYKEGLEIKRNYNPGNEPSKATWTTGGVGIFTWEMKEGILLGEGD